MKPLFHEAVFNKVIILLFLVLIFIPPAKMLFSPAKNFSESEKRKLADLPDFPNSLYMTKNYFKALDTYFSDHFGYRDFFINRYHSEIAQHFGKTGIESKVILGKDDWFFFTAKNQLQDFEGRLMLSRNELTDWIKEKNDRQQWLASLGIEYILLAPPGKHTIYPEFLPDKIQRQKGTSRFEQLIDFTADRPLPYLINLHQALSEAKEKQSKNLYYKSDTHWNMRGAFVAYLALAEKLQQLFPDQQFKTDFAFGEDILKSCRELPNNCDLARMAMQQDWAMEAFPTLKEFERCARPRSFKHYTLSNFEQSRSSPSYARGCKDRELTALVFRDSFFVDIQPFLSENFRHIVYLWKPYDQQNIEEIFAVYTPDVVIEAIVERDFFQ